MNTLNVLKKQLVVFQMILIFRYIFFVYTAAKDQMHIQQRLRGYTLYSEYSFLSVFQIFLNGILSKSGHCLIYSYNIIIIYKDRPDSTVRRNIFSLTFIFILPSILFSLYVFVCFLALPGDFIFKTSQTGAVPSARMDLFHKKNKVDDGQLPISHIR